MKNVYSDYINNENGVTEMAVSAQTQSMLNGKARMLETFSTEKKAKEFAATKTGNVRISAFVDYKKADGTKVYAYAVRWNF